MNLITRSDAIAIAFAFDKYALTSKLNQAIKFSANNAKTYIVFKNDDDFYHGDIHFSTDRDPWVYTEECERHRSLIRHKISWAIAELKQNGFFPNIVEIPRLAFDGQHAAFWLEIRW